MKSNKKYKKSDMLIDFHVATQASVYFVSSLFAGVAYRNLMKITNTSFN
jgi:hypothetical protein